MIVCAVAFTDVECNTISRTALPCVIWVSFVSRIPFSILSLTAITTATTTTIVVITIVAPSSPPCSTGRSVQPHQVLATRLLPLVDAKYGFEARWGPSVLEIGTCGLSGRLVGSVFAVSGVSLRCHPPEVGHCRRTSGAACYQPVGEGETRFGS
ncbi:hypothetical protein HD806DRAFT_196564 [Xylariaceae sp. AK1471]|nr:hypothetical protein HD806DRAFT_196564 [Xylariaceae sp. AK1471]